MNQVLIVDDKEENVYYLQALLAGHGWTVTTARHGAEALVKARQVFPQLVISDLLMPVMDGYTLLSHWKADDRLKRIPFIVYTATYTEPEDEALALSLGADAFILKPCEPEDFLVRIAEVQGRIASEERTPKAPSGDEKDRLKLYSETLIRKLEEKSLKLVEANQSLEQDIAQRKQVEAALRESEAEFRLLAEAMPQIVWITGPDGRYLYFNEHWMEYTSLRLEEGLGDGWLTPFHPSDKKRAEEAWRQALATAQDFSIEARLRRSDGAFRWWLTRGVPVHDVNGRIIKWFGTCTDIDELKRAQEQIEEQASLLDQTSDAIIVNDLQHRVIFWSRGAERIFGWLKSEAVGHDLNDLIQPKPGALHDALSAVIANGHWSGEIQETARNGAQLTVETRWALLRDEQGEPRSMLAICTDITERKKLEQQFLRIQRMESIGTLAGGIAHDLNNVLSPIMMSLAVLHNRFTDPASQSLLEILRASAERGADMVRQILSFARGVEGRRVEVQLKHLIGEIEKIARDTFPKNITVRASVPHGLKSVSADPTQIHQVLLNLCVNARDAMPKGGVLELVAEGIDLNEAQAAQDHGTAPGCYILIQVRDTGVGMPPEVMEKIFDPFFTTKEIGKGTGLGLSTSLGIVKSHGGFLRVESELGRGSRFSVYLPVQTEPCSSSSSHEATTAPRGNGQLILVADDEAFVRQVLQRTLESFGYRVLLVGDGAEAVAAYAMHVTEIAAVLIDMMMPVMDGPSAVQILRRMSPGLLIIGASGLSTQNQEALAMKSGVNLFLAKPYTADTLLAALAKILPAPALQSAEAGSEN